MGIYPQCGIVYIAIVNGKIIEIASMKDLDKRLLSSEYYKSHKDRYNKHICSITNLKSWNHKITEPIDIKLNEHVHELLKMIKYTYGDKIEHGFYDTGCVFCTN